MPRAATIGAEAEGGTAGLVGFEGETVSEARESGSVNVGKRKRKQQEKKLSQYFCDAHYAILFYFFTQIVHARKATTR